MKKKKSKRKKKQKLKELLNDNLNKFKKDKVLIYGILFSVAVILIYLGFFSWLFFSWLSNPYINYGIMIPFISAYLIYKKSENAKVEINPYGLFLIIFAVFLFFFSSMYIKALSFMLLVIGLLIYFLGFEFFNKVRFEILYLLFMIPLPEMFIESIGLRLKDVSLSLTFAILSPFLDLGLSSDYITLSGERILRYGLPCSGLESFLAFLAFSVLFAYLYEKKIWRAILLVSVSPFIAIFFNSIRLSILVFVAMMNIDIILTTFHLTSGPFLVVLYGIILIFLYRRSIWKK